MPPTPPGRGLPLHESPSTRSYIKTTILKPSEGQNLEEPIGEEKTKTILGKVIAGELPEEILKTVQLPKLPKLPKAEISLDKIWTSGTS